MEEDGLCMTIFALYQQYPQRNLLSGLIVLGKFSDIRCAELLLIYTNIEKISLVWESLV